MIHLVLVNPVLSILAGAVNTLFTTSLWLILFLLLGIHLIALLINVALPAHV